MASPIADPRVRCITFLATGSIEYAPCTFKKFQMLSSVSSLLLAILREQNSENCPVVRAFSSWLLRLTSSVSVTTWLMWTWRGTSCDCCCCWCCCCCCCCCSECFGFSKLISLPPNYNKEITLSYKEVKCCTYIQQQGHQVKELRFW